MTRLFGSLLLGAVLVSACSDPSAARHAGDAGAGDAARAFGGRDSSVDGSPASGLADGSSPDGSVMMPGPDATTDGGAGEGPYPKTLSRTGLFADLKTEQLGPGVREYQPKYTLWSDGATKRRWLYLPAGAQIDTTDMDYWVYPVGTKVWKEFTFGTTRLETRMLHKVSTTEWVMISYQWRADRSDADAVPDGVVNADGAHDIPRQSDCMFCHGNMADKLLGVTAIQLSHDLPGVKMSDLVTESRLTSPPVSELEIPGGSTAEQALGYLHANCGHCHNPKSSVSVFRKLDLWESTASLDTVEHTTGYRTTVGQPNAVLPYLHIIEPGYPSRSELFLRISTRGPEGVVSQMPPLATKSVDPSGIAKVKAFIESLPPMPDGGTEDAGIADSGMRDAARD